MSQPSWMLTRPSLRTGDEADAKLIHVTGRKEMQVVDHGVVTTHELLIATRRILDLQLPRSLYVGATRPIVDLHGVAPRESHLDRAAGQVVGAMIAIELPVEVTARFRHVGVM